MLSPDEFFAGTLKDAEPLTLILPFQKNESRILVGRSKQNGAPAACFPDDNYRWFECSDNEHWKGLLVPNVQIEVDEASVFDPKHTLPICGCVIRRSTYLVVVVKPEFGHAYNSVILVDGLTPSIEGAAFSRWQVALGDGSKKRILLTIDALSGATPR